MLLTDEAQEELLLERWSVLRQNPIWPSVRHTLSKTGW